MQKLAGVPFELFCTKKAIVSFKCVWNCFLILFSRKERCHTELGKLHSKMPWDNGSHHSSRWFEATSCSLHQITYCEVRPKDILFLFHSTCQILKDTERIQSSHFRHVDHRNMEKCQNVRLFWEALEQK